MAASRLHDPDFLDGISQFRSFRDQVLSGTSSMSSFSPFKVSFCHGLPALLISDEELNSLAAPFELALVGKFPGSHPSLESIRNFFFNLKLNGEFSVTVVNKNNVLIKLRNDLDYYRVFTHRSYFVNNCYMKLVKWSPHFDVCVESPIILIWISFPNLRPHLFSSRILQGLGFIFGRPLKIDNATANGTRPSVACVLVDLDITKRYPDQVWLGFETLGYAQNVEMEVSPLYCGHYKALGHSKADCIVLHPHPVVVPAHACDWFSFRTCGSSCG
ncbi:uncharacterized protein LOC110104437 [Dendrobium catenatum]|uniref:uncharacterized protein LOC110104437 n=1 Tax=Dendrobium catenatum TaxID=906689 RepID=UPI0010A0A0D3|nr:uncharacterized protein LOC110104437 [Dendrobium catenatum]